MVSSEAIKLNPNDVDAYFKRGKAYCYKEEYGLAMADLSEAIKLKPKDTEVYSIRYFISYEKECKKDIADFSEAIVLAPKDANVYFNRGKAYLRKGERDLAIADFSEAIGLDPNNPTVFLDRGEVYLMKGEHDLAIADFSEAIKLEPKDAVDAIAYGSRGKAYSEKGRYDLAFADFSEAIRLSPNSFTYNTRGDAYREKGELDLAIADFSEAIKLSPNIFAYRTRGYAYREKGELDLAIADFSEVIRLNPENSKTYFDRSTLYMKKGEFNLAIADCHGLLKAPLPHFLRPSPLFAQIVAFYHVIHAAAGHKRHIFVHHLPTLHPVAFQGGLGAVGHYRQYLLRRQVVIPGDIVIMPGLLPAPPLPFMPCPLGNPGVPQQGFQGEARPVSQAQYFFLGGLPYLKAHLRLACLGPQFFFLPICLPKVKHHPCG